MSLLTTAYAGTGDLKDENVDALINQLLPDGPLGMVYIPSGTIVKRNQPGLAKVVNWLQTNENGVGVEGTIPVKDLIHAMLERNTAESLAEDERDEPDELLLVMAFNPASGVDVSLVKEAHEAGIRVIDLCAAGDDIVPEDPEPPAEDEPVAGGEETPPWEGSPDEPTDPTPPPTAPKESPAERVAVAAQAGRAAAAKHREPAPEPPATVTPSAPAATPGLVFQVQVTIAPENVAAFARAIVDAMGAQATAVVESAPLASVTALPVGDAGTNPDDPAGQPEGTKVYYYHADEDKYRPARGTKRRGEERVYLTDAEINDIKAKGLHR